MSALAARAVNWRVPEWIGYPASRVLCRMFRRHTLFCRGRSDHARGGKLIDAGRWLS